MVEREERGMTNLFYAGLISFMIFVLLIVVFMFGLAVLIGVDAYQVRGQACQDVVVYGTSMGGDAATLYITTHDGSPKMLLDTANVSIIRKWGRINPGDIVSMKLGERTAELC
jgi:hypothetical protein